MSEQKQTIDERFTDLADIISEMIGRWWVTAISLVCVLIWLAIGPFVHFSDSWQLWMNSPTTVAELFIGFLIAAATNRVERRHELLLKEIKGHTRADEATTKRDADVNRRSEGEIQEIQRDLEFIKRQLAKLVTE